MLPALGTLRNKIVNRATGQPIRLKGVNRSGFEYSSPDGSGSLHKAGISASELNRIADWNVNLIRLPFNQQWALSTSDYDAEPYLSAIDQVVTMAADRSLYTLLDLQWLSAEAPRGHLKDGSPNYVPPLPNLQSLTLWRQLATRYQAQPGVLYDIFNEPHDALPDDTTELAGIRPDQTLYRRSSRRVGPREWHPWAVHLVNAIRSVHPLALIFVSGLDWGYDLHSYPLRNIHDVVYSSHVYPRKKNWDRAFGNLSRSQPVFVAEWGGHDADIAWGIELLKYLDERDLGWAAWSWCDQPYLIKSGTDCEPTLFGSVVQASLRDQKLS